MAVDPAGGVALDQGRVAGGVGDRGEVAVAVEAEPHLDAVGIDDPPDEPAGDRQAGDAALGVDDLGPGCARRRRSGSGWRRPSTPTTSATRSRSS